MRKPSKRSNLIAAFLVLSDLLVLSWCPYSLGQIENGFFVGGFTFMYFKPSQENRVPSCLLTCK